MAVSQLRFNTARVGGPVRAGPASQPGRQAGRAGCILMYSCANGCFSRTTNYLAGRHPVGLAHMEPWKCIFAVGLSKESSVLFPTYTVLYPSFVFPYLEINNSLFWFCRSDIISHKIRVTLNVWIFEVFKSIFFVAVHIFRPVFLTLIHFKVSPYL